MNKNIKLKEGFSQVCVMEGTIVKPDMTEKEFEYFFLEKEDVNVQYLEEVKTFPTIRNGKTVPDTGGRNDVIFAIHDNDIAKFAIKRLVYSIRWLEDVYDNGGGSLYEDRIKDYMNI